MLTKIFRTFCLVSGLLVLSAYITGTITLLPAMIVLFGINFFSTLTSNIDRRYFSSWNYVTGGAIVGLVFSLTIEGLVNLQTYVYGVNTGFGSYFDPVVLWSGLIRIVFSTATAAIFLGPALFAFIDDILNLFEVEGRKSKEEYLDHYNLAKARLEDKIAAFEGLNEFERDINRLDKRNP